MKKKHILTICAAILAAFLFSFCSYRMGFEKGKEHVLIDSELVIVDFDPPEDGVHDLTIYIDIDGETYAHYGFIG